MSVKSESNIKFNKYYVILIILIFILIVVKTFLTFQSSFLDNSSYFHLTNANSIISDSKIVLNYSFEDDVALPILDYILAFFGLFCNLEIIAKLLSIIISSSIVLMVFFIVDEIIKNKKIAVISTLFASFIPVLFIKFTNRFSNIEFSILIFLLTILFFIKSMNATKFIKFFIIFLIFLIILTPLSLVFIGIFILYFLMLKSERMRIRLSEIETFMFSLILGGWLYILIYKDLILNDNFLLFSKNIILNSFKLSSITEIISSIGIIPVILGVIGIYLVLQKKNSREIIFISSFIILLIVFTVLKLINQYFGLIMTSLGLIIISGFTINEFEKFISISKLKKILSFFYIFIILIFIITSVVPSFIGGALKSQDVMTENDFEVLNWIKSNTPEDSIIFSLNDESYLISYFSNRKTIFNNDAFNSDLIDKVKDSEKVYSLSMNTETLRILSYYNSNYIFISSKTLETMTKISFEKFSDHCYDKEFFSKDSRIYKIMCTIKNEQKINNELFD